MLYYCILPLYRGESSCGGVASAGSVARFIIKEKTQTNVKLVLYTYIINILIIKLIRNKHGLYTLIIKEKTQTNGFMTCYCHYCSVHVLPWGKISHARNQHLTNHRGFPTAFSVDLQLRFPMEFHFCDFWCSICCPLLLSISLLLSLVVVVVAVIAVVVVVVVAVGE